MIGRFDVDLGASRDWRLVPAALAVWLATMAGLLLGWWWSAAGGLVAVVVAVVVLVRSRGRSALVRWWRLGVAWSLLVCGLLVGVVGTLRLRSAEEDPLRVFAGDSASGRFRFEITERAKPVFSAGFGGQQGGVRAVVLPARVTTAVVAGRPIRSSGAVVVIAPADPWRTLLPGQQVTANAVMAPADSGELTVAVLRVRGPPGAVTEAAAWQRVAQTLRSGLREAARVLDPEPGGLLPALVVGDTDDLSKEVVDEFQAAGLAHLLAVSGTNLAVVCVAALLLLRTMRAGPRGAAAGAMVALVGFVVLAGPEPSVLRAGVMGAVGLLALAVGRQRAALPALGVAVIVLVMCDPAMAVSIGFALSVLATAGLVLIAPRWAERLAALGLPRGVAEALAVPAAAHLVTAPVVAGFAGQVSLVAVVANLLAAPVVAPATVLGVLAAVVAPVAPWLAELLVRLAGPEADWLILVAGHAAAVPGAVIAWPTGWLGGLLLAGCVVLLVAALRRRRLRVLIGVLLTGLLLVVIPVRVIAPGWPPAGWAVVACDVGQGDALVLATGDAGRAVVVDTGPEPASLAGCLDRLDVSRVPLVVLSHLHADHVGGLNAVLDDRAVGAVGVSRARAPRWAWEEVRGKARNAGVPVVQLVAGQRLAWPGLTIEVLAPDDEEVMPANESEGTEINNASLVLRAATPAGRVLLSGDVELAAQARLLDERVDLSADVIKVPHHGSRYTTPELFAAVRARIALVSVGQRNRYGHPSPFTLRALASTGTLVLRTDIGGDTAIVPTAAGPRAVTRGPARSPPHGSAAHSRRPWLPQAHSAMAIDDNRRRRAVAISGAGR
jgi:competence protein ComEC